MDVGIKKSKYKTILQNKNYMYYLIGQVISRFGDSVDSVAYAWMVYEISGSTALMALLFGVNALPNILLQPLCGVLVSYMRKKDVLLICNLGRGIVVSLTIFMFISNQLEVYHLFIFTILNSIFESFQYPASSACLPLLLDEEEYAHGVGLRSTLSQFVEVLGLSAAGFLIAILTLPGAMIIDAISFFVCGILQYLPQYRMEKIKKQKLDTTVFFSDLKEGFQFVFQSSIIINIIIFGAFFSIFLLPLNTLSVVYASEYLGLGIKGVSFISGGMGIGMLIGSFFFPKLRERFNARNTFVYSGILFGVLYLSCAFWPLLPLPLLPYVTLFGCLILGITASSIIGVINVAFLEHVPQEFLARVSGVFNSLANVAVPLGSMVVALLCNFMSVLELFFFFGAGVFLLFIVQLGNKSLRKL